MTDAPVPRSSSGTVELAERFHLFGERAYRPEVFGADDKASGPMVTQAECRAIAAAIRGVAQPSSGTESLLVRAERIIGVLLDWPTNWTVPFESEDEWLGDKEQAKALRRDLNAALSAHPADWQLIKAILTTSKNRIPSNDIRDYCDGGKVELWAKEIAGLGCTKPSD